MGGFEIDRAPARELLPCIATDIASVIGFEGLVTTLTERIEQRTNRRFVTAGAFCLEVDVDITVVQALRSSVEDRWRETAKAAGKGADLEAMRKIDPDLVEKESNLLGGALRQVVENIPDGGRALVVGHSPTNEAAVLGLVGEVISPLGKGDGVVISDDAGRYRIEPID